FPHLYSLSLHDALPILVDRHRLVPRPVGTAVVHPDAGPSAAERRAGPADDERRPGRHTRGADAPAGGGRLLHALRLQRLPGPRRRPPQRIITLSSVRRVPRERWPTTRVDEHATALDDDCTALADEPMDAVLDKLARNEHHRVVVIDDGTVVGIITPRDLARWLERSQALGMTEPLD